MSESGVDTAVEIPRPEFLQKIYDNLQVIPISTDSTPFLRKGSQSDSELPQNISTQDANIQLDQIREQITAMHQQREGEHDRQIHDMHQAREKEVTQQALDLPKEVEAMHIQRESERKAQIEALVLHKTRIGLAAIEAWTQRHETDPDEIKKMAKFTGRLRKFLYGFTDSGITSFSGFIDAAAKTYITDEAIAASVYGGKDDLTMTITPEDSYQDQLTIIGHDINTPITGMSGYAQLLARSRAKGAENPTALEVIQRTTQQLHDEALFSQELIDSGFTHNVFTGEQLGDAVKKHLEPGATITVSDETLGVKIDSSEKWLKMFLSNVQKNALEQYAIRDTKFPQRIGEVDSEGKQTKDQMKVTIDLVEHAGVKQIRMLVTDVATGFSAKKLLEGFKRHASEKTDSGGTGMALATCVAAGDKIYRYDILPQTVTYDQEGNLIRVIESKDIRDARNKTLVAKEIKSGKVISEKEITAEDVAISGDTPYTGAQIQILCRVIE